MWPHIERHPISTVLHNSSFFAPTASDLDEKKLEAEFVFGVGRATGGHTMARLQAILGDDHGRLQVKFFTATLWSRVLPHVDLGDPFLQRMFRHCSELSYSSGEQRRQ